MLLSLHRSQVLRLCLAFFSATLTASAFARPLVVGYSDWPGWVAWEVAVEKQWFAEAGLEVEFEWFDYAASMEAFAAGQLDAVTMTNGDTLVTGSTGAQAVMILVATTQAIRTRRMMVAALPKTTTMRTPLMIFLRTVTTKRIFRFHQGR